jgi:hypothetical protein
MTKTHQQGNNRAGQQHGNEPRSTIEHHSKFNVWLGKRESSSISKHQHAYLIDEGETSKVLPQRDDETAPIGDGGGHHHHIHHILTHGIGLQKQLILSGQQHSNRSTAYQQHINRLVQHSSSQEHILATGQQHIKRSSTTTGQQQGSKLTTQHGNSKQQVETTQHNNSQQHSNNISTTQHNNNNINNTAQHSNNISTTQHNIATTYRQHSTTQQQVNNTAASQQHSHGIQLTQEGRARGDTANHSWSYPTTTGFTGRGKHSSPRAAA